MGTNLYTQRVRRRRILWSIWSTIVAAMVVAVALGLAIMVFDLIQDNVSVSLMRRVILWSAVTGGVASFFLGQFVQGLLRQSWDSWIAGLDVAEVRVLIAQMEQHAKSLENGAKSESVKK